MDTRAWARQGMNELIRSNFVIAAVSSVIALAFAGLGFVSGGDSADVAYMGTILFGLIALAYGGQALSFKRKMKKAGL